MAYREFPPIAALRPRVDAYWINRRDAGDGTPIDRVLPDACIDLVFRSGADGGWLFSSALVERPIYFDGNGPAWYVGVRFRPAMARGVLIVDPADCRDRNLPAREIDPWFATLEAQLQDAASPEQAFAILKRAVDARLARNDRHRAPTRVQEALRLLARGGDAAQVRHIARRLGIAERSLHRDLVRWSGLSPKILARILRMQRTLTAIRTGPAVPLAHVALHMGYADQAHMTRELKDLSGYAPSELQRVRNLQDAT
jgi:AraC-like DNA-binding protein